MALDLRPDTTVQDELCLEPQDDEPSLRDGAALMGAMDALNPRFGKGTVHVSSTGSASCNRVWTMRQERLTPHYTTRWEELAVVRA